MRILVQRVRHASVTVDNAVVASIDAGLLCLVGFGQHDTRTFPQQAAWRSMVDKLVHLRIFPDAVPPDKMQNNVQEFGGQILLVPQFTLYADCRRGRRPDFQDASSPEIARNLFEEFVQAVDVAMPNRIQHGIFGASMEVNLCNWGPVTLMLDSEVLFPNV